MKRTMIAVALVVGFAAAANAATLSVVTDKLTYTVGDTIFLTVTATTSGESPTPNIVVELQWDQVRVSPDNCGVGMTACATSIDTLSSFNGNGLWSPGGGQGNCDSGPNNRCRAFDQIAFNSGLAVDDSANPAANTDNDGNPGTAGDGTWDSFFEFSAVSTGTANFDFNPAQFFGIGGPAPGSFVAGNSVTIFPIPEPTTVALLGLGLFGLAMGGRRR